MEFIDRNRIDAPRWLVDNAERWGRDWAERLRVYEESPEDKKKPRWIWHEVDGHGHAELVEHLGVMTERHCSYCDAFPMGERLQETIDHFKPKADFPKEAYLWDNLFLSCRLCQEKQFDEKLLKPDDPGYGFDTFFLIDYESGELKPRGNPGELDYERADATLKRLKLNENGKPEDRLRELDHYELADRGGDTDLNEWAYRFFLRRATDSTSADGSAA